MKSSQSYEVIGYKTLTDFQIFNGDQLCEYETRGKAFKMLEDQIKTNQWYAVKIQSDDREFIDIKYLTNKETIR